jgi:hypothetical protein
LIFIDFSFCFCNQSGGHDAYPVIAQDVYDVKQYPGGGQPDNSFSKFTAYNLIVEITNERVEECFASQFKTDIVFPQVDSRLLTIPLKDDIVKRISDVPSE